ncbi:hypothetical protein [Nitrosovibrio sp. Nv17]|jgi:hypothetical protein|uniref:hypothetical protein n=1 Tax=Nitrosovibrio sp. Nv17 TaxID=1855339 RepID=UPI000908E951|nr:hypothetical protein [Nitrosovibrio sp. Nv17]SFW18280.1 hypothetical protein SAMN05216414_104123 [Nitrosovibrio sp. Nv17]
MPQVLQDIIFITVVVIAFIALLRLSDKATAWFNARSRRSSAHSSRRRDRRSE